MILSWSVRSGWRPAERRTGAEAPSVQSPSSKEAPRTKIQNPRRGRRVIRVLDFDPSKTSKFEKRPTSHFIFMSDWRVRKGKIGVRIKPAIPKLRQNLNRNKPELNQINPPRNFGKSITITNTLEGGPARSSSVQPPSRAATSTKFE